MKIKDLQTTIPGIAGGLLMVFEGIVTKSPEKIVQGVAFALMGYFAKDKSNKNEIYK